MGRVMIVLVVGGIALAVFGWMEYQVSKDATSDPQRMDVAEFEKAGAIRNNHVELGPHIRFYGAAVYEAQVPTAGSEPTDSSKCNYAYIPVMDPNHPVWKRVEELQAKEEAGEDVPDDAWPDITDFRILIKCKRFKTVGDIPDTVEGHGPMRGLVVSRVTSLDSDERRLLKESWPDVDFSKIVIIEEDRSPLPVTLTMAMMGGGGLLVLAPLGILLVMRRRNNPRPPKDRSMGRDALYHAPPTPPSQDR